MITTIITTYRRPHLLKRAINSVLKQTYSDFQICIYDNASGDETEEIVRSLMKEDSRIQYHRHQENIGMMGNYEFAFSKIDTEYFSLLSDDDFLLPEFFETALKDLERFPDAAFAACGVLQIDENGQYVGDPLSSWKTEGYHLPFDAMRSMLKGKWNYPVPTGILFQSKLLKKISPNFSPEIDFFWDPDFLLRIAEQFPIITIKKACAAYLTHSQSFAYSFYTDLLNAHEMQSGEKYLKATKLTRKAIDESENL